MAKSIRSKAKRSYRSKKRENGVYAATEAARLHRLNAKLAAAISNDGQGDALMHDPEGNEEETLDSGADAQNGVADTMIASTEPLKPVSTHGPRGSRREEWRRSKGLDPKPTRNGMNHQGGLAGRRKAGRSKRRR